MSETTRASQLNCFLGGGGEPVPPDTGADAWFDFREADRIEIKEQAFLLPNDEVLTLLILPEEALG